MHARGVIVGLTRGTTRAHIARATLESIALPDLDVVEAMASGRGRAAAELRVDGGAAANDLLMQLQADLLGLPVERPPLPRPPPWEPPTSPASPRASGPEPSLTPAVAGRPHASRRRWTTRA